MIARLQSARLEESCLVYPPTNLGRKAAKFPPSDSFFSSKRSPES